MLRNILKSRTRFSFFVQKALFSCRSGSKILTATALFPIPLPRDDAWNLDLKHVGSDLRRRKAVKMILHLVVLALNYLHFRNPFQVLDVIGRRPSEAHKAVFARLSALIRAGGPTEEFSILGCDAAEKHFN